MKFYRSKGGYFYKEYKNGKKVRISNEEYLKQKKKQKGGTLNKTLLSKIPGCTELKADDYNLVRKLSSQGAAATVFEGVNTVSKEKKIIKEFDQGIDILREQRKFDNFKYEIIIGELAKKENCPHIVHVDGYYNFGNFSYIVMEYISGCNIKEYKETNPEKPTEKDIELFGLQLANGLKFLHDRNIAHYDLKPANIMRTDKGVVKIVDLGVSHHPNLKRCLYKGTPLYSPPNHINNITVTYITLDKGIDIWSYGNVLYFYMTGKNFAGFNLSDTQVTTKNQLKKFITSGNVIKKINRNCSEFPDILTIIKGCCMPTSKDRLTIDQIIELLQWHLNNN